MRLIVHRDCLELTDRFRALADEGKTMPRATTALLSTAAAAVLLAACGTDGGGGPNSASATSESAASQEPSSAASTIEAPTDPPATDIPADVATDGAPAFPESTARQTAEPSGKWGLVLTDVRVGDHVGFDRIVLEFAGNGTPGWVVNYVDEARLDGSGKAVTLGGEAVLDIYASAPHTLGLRGTTTAATDSSSPGRAATSTTSTSAARLRATPRSSPGSRATPSRSGSSHSPIPRAWWSTSSTNAPTDPAGLTDSLLQRAAP